MKSYFVYCFFIHKVHVQHLIDSNGVHLVTRLCWGFAYNINTQHFLHGV